MYDDVESRPIRRQGSVEIGADVDDIDSGVGAAGSLQRMEDAKYEAEKRIRASGQASTAAASVLSTVLNRVKSLDGHFVTTCVPSRPS